MVRLASDCKTNDDTNRQEKQPRKKEAKMVWVRDGPKLVARTAQKKKAKETAALEAT
jgi:hypothetical protein